jgi:hypothetical protein
MARAFVAGPDRSINNDAGTVASPWSAAVSRNRLTTSDMSFATPSLRVLHPTHAAPHNSVLRSAIDFLTSKKEQAALLAPSKRAKKVPERQKWDKNEDEKKWAKNEALISGSFFMVLLAFMLYCTLRPAGWRSTTFQLTEALEGRGSDAQPNLRRLNDATQACPRRTHSAKPLPSQRSIVGSACGLRDRVRPALSARAIALAVGSAWEPWVQWRRVGCVRRMCPKRGC